VSFLKLRVGAVALALVAALVVAGCGSSSSDSSASSGDTAASGGGSSSGGAPETTSLTVGIVGLAADAPIYIANEKGWFRDAGIEVRPQVVGSGAASLAAVVGNANQIGTGNLLSLVQADARGLDIRAIAPANEAAESASDAAHATSAVIVPRDSPIATVQDLAGKTIAVNAVKSLGDLTILQSLQRKGVDTSGIRFVELGFPDMLTALDSGRVDAIWEVEPFVTAARAEGGRVVDVNFEGTAPRFPLGLYYATERFIADNPNTIRAFSDVIRRANQYADDNPDEVRRSVLTFTRIPPEAARTMALTINAQDFTQANIDLLGQLMLRQRLVDRLPDMTRVFGPIIGG
jgi:NitT/TauT family transport system substrate-binding protein